MYIAMGIHSSYSMMSQQQRRHEKNEKEYAIGYDKGFCCGYWVGAEAGWAEGFDTGLSEGVKIED